MTELIFLGAAVGLVAALLIRLLATLIVVWFIE